jgi:hypothetical protein
MIKWYNLFIYLVYWNMGIRTPRSKESFSSLYILHNVVAWFSNYDSSFDLQV